jgi:hypothetical protein
MDERRGTSTRRRNTRSGRRSTDPRPAPIEGLEIEERTSPPARALARRVEALEQKLHTQLQRITSLQAALDRLTASLQRVTGLKLRKSKRS